MQGVEIDDKHVEVMVEQMLRKVKIIEAGDTKLLPGSLVDIHNFTDANREAFKNVNAQLLQNQYYLVLLKHLLKQLLICGFIPETTRVLTDAAIKVNAMTYLDLKRMLLSVNLSAGTGMRRYSDVKYDKVSTPVAEADEAEVTE